MIGLRAPGLAIGPSCPANYFHLWLDCARFTGPYGAHQRCLLITQASPARLAWDATMATKTRAEKFEDEKRRIVETCFAKKDEDGSRTLGPILSSWRYFVAVALELLPLGSA